MVKRLITAFIPVCLCMLQSLAQPVVTRAGFVADSVMIGEEVPYYLTASYSERLNVLFPDSTHSFFPFEFQRKKYFPTRTGEGVSYDSVVYYLSTFEIDSLQILQTPVFVLHASDCTTVMSPADTIRLQELVTMPLPDTLKAENLPLLIDTEYRPVSWLLNYPVLLYVAGGLLMVSIIAWLAFGKRIRKHFLVKRLQKKHLAFQLEFEKLTTQLRQEFRVPLAERSIALWKRYMEELDNRPYTRLTTRETLRLLNNVELAEQLRSMDGAVYGSNTQVEGPLLHLRTHAEKTFQERLAQVTHG